MGKYLGTCILLPQRTMWERYDFSAHCVEFSAAHAATLTFSADDAARYDRIICVNPGWIGTGLTLEWLRSHGFTGEWNVIEVTTACELWLKFYKEGVPGWYSPRWIEARREA